MEDTQALPVVRRMYAAVLADAVRQFAATGVLEQVTRSKREEQLATGAARADQLGIARAEEAFTKLAALFDCADWKIEGLEDGFRATASRCMLCALARRMKAPSPCRIYCLDPMEGIVRGREPSAGFEVESTLFDSDRCAVRVRRP